MKTSIISFIFVGLFFYLLIFHLSEINKNQQNACMNFCKRENTYRIQESAGVCLCGTKEGLKAQKGYLLYLDNKCKNEEKEETQ